MVNYARDLIKDNQDQTLIAPYCLVSGQLIVYTGDGNPLFSAGVDFEFPKVFHNITGMYFNTKATFPIGNPQDNKKIGATVDFVSPMDPKSLAFALEIDIDVSGLSDMVTNIADAIQGLAIKAKTTFDVIETAITNAEADLAIITNTNLTPSVPSIPSICHQITKSSTNRNIALNETTTVTIGGGTVAGITIPKTTTSIPTPDLIKAASDEADIVAYTVQLAPLLAREAADNAAITTASIGISALDAATVGLADIATALQNATNSVHIDSATITVNTSESAENLVGQNFVSLIQNGKFDIIVTGSINDGATPFTATCLQISLNALSDMEKLIINAIKQAIAKNADVSRMGTKLQSQLRSAHMILFGDTVTINSSQWSNYRLSARQSGDNGSVVINTNNALEWSP